MPENKGMMEKAYPISIEGGVTYPMPYVEKVPVPLDVGVIQLCKGLGVAFPGRVIPPE